MVPSLTEAEKERLDLVAKILQLREFYSVKDILRSKAFLKCFSIASPQMASSEEDNAEEKNAGDAPHVGADEGESRHSRDDSLEYVGAIRKGLKRGILSSLPNEDNWGQNLAPSFIKWDPSSSIFISSSEI